MTNTAVVGGNITGNIGSCSVVSTDVQVSSFYQQTIAVNSCTGEMFSNSGVYFDSTWLVIPGIIFTVIFSFIGSLSFFSSRY